MNKRCSDTRQLPEEFIKKLKRLAESYLSDDDPIRQSGFGGGEIRWRNERSVILEAVKSDGDFLDVGCANGYLLDCLVRWASESGYKLIPYGVDQSQGLIELAKKRLPEYTSHFWIANAWDWTPPRKFRFVYTLFDCVPDSYFGEYIEKLLEKYVEKDGVLIVGAYGSTSQQSPARDIERELVELGFNVSGGASVGDLPVSRIAWIRN